MKTITGVLLLSVLLAGCRAHMMETQGDTVSLFHLKSGNPERGGVIRYLNTGLQSWRQARAKDAAKQMTTFCSGSYRTVAEGPRSKFGADMPIGKSASFEVDEYWYIRFACEAAPKG